ncbi:RNA polymerase sigma factor [Nibricoccus aquaticus]|uniref:RNA polymerase sigma factor n=1 Tax=Nibricoccus aquaticus TaxID=2576891 RepID=UPI001C2F36E9|nr:RNA polymerase sigma factor [Nibricoccus aquaticus]
MTLGELHREHYGRILASLIRAVRDFTLAEDALQEAFAIAVAQWPQKGPPPNPVAWLLATARNKAIDQIRHRAMAAHKHEEMITLATLEESAPEPADTLRLIFTCCHPAIAPEAQIALTLHTVCGLTTEEIARAFLVPVPTLAQRLVRAKTKIKLAAIPYSIPGDDELPSRLSAALHVVYLVFNEGYSASSGTEIIRADLCADAIRLARQLVGLLPLEREPRALLALMLLNDARRPARTDASGDLVLLEDQDRTLWDRAKIAEGTALLDAIFSHTSPSPSPTTAWGKSLRGAPYALQAAIAALHANAPTADKTDWPQIAALYALLAQLTPSPIIELNRAVAIAMSGHLENALTLLDQLDLPGYHRLPAARADLLRRTGRFPEAAVAYGEALSLVRNDAERRHLQKRLQEVSTSSP